MIATKEARGLGLHRAPANYISKRSPNLASHNPATRKVSGKAPIIIQQKLSIE